jgi:hypothetical protein
MNATNFRKLYTFYLNAENIDIEPNSAVYFETDTGNPTAGNSDIRFIGKYRVIDLN